MSGSLWQQFEGVTIENKYRLERFIAAGGFGGVFVAAHVVSGRLLTRRALKLILPDETFMQAQLEELVQATRLSHPNLLGCLDAGKCVLRNIELLYLVMDLAESNLAGRLEQGVLTPDEALELARQIASALEYLRSRPEHLVHRDLKPANILRVGDVWKLSDFGLVRALGTVTAARTSTLIGTPQYCPPEGYEGIISPAWDMWSLGVTLALTLTGELPFNGNTSQELHAAIARREPFLPSPLPRPLDAIVRGCLAKDPRVRWTARQVIEHLDSAATGALSAGRPRRVFNRKFAAAAAVLVIALVALLLAARSRFPGPTPASDTAIQVTSPVPEPEALQPAPSAPQQTPVKEQEARAAPVAPPAVTASEPKAEPARPPAAAEKDRRKEAALKALFAEEERRRKAREALLKQEDQP